MKSRKVSTAPTRPILRYHGGKWMLAPWIISHFPEHRVYVEPFGGAGSVLLRKPRAYAEIWNDLDGELNNLFEVVRNKGEALTRAVYLTPFSRTDFKLSFMPTANKVEQARRTIVRSMMGFGSNSHAKNTGFRTNSNRSGTTPAHDWANYPESMARTVERLRGVILENRDGIEVMAQHDSKDTLHYVDPPYVASTRGVGNDYRYEMTDLDHAKLSEFLHSVKGMVVLSGYDSPLYRELYRGWRTVKRASLADGAQKREETLWFNDNVKQEGLLL